MQEEGFQVAAVSDPEAALASAQATPPDLVFLGSEVEGEVSLHLLKVLQQLNDDILVIAPTNQPTVKAELDAMDKRVTLASSPAVQVDQVKIAIRDALKLQELKAQQTYFQKQEKQRYQFASVIAESPKMQAVLRLVTQVLGTDATVLLLGETGTGKEVIAKAIHYNGPRAAAPFLAVNCTAMPETLLESELFGHEAGAFTDARKLKKGLFEVAHSGTLFLDEVGDLPLALQSKLLRVVEEKNFHRIGGTFPISVNTRIIAATHRNLEEAVRTGTFREDLYFRLRVFPIYLPPLREHLEDTVPLAKHFMGELNAELRKEIKGLSFRAEQQLRRYHWPGNSRELRNVIERAMLLTSHDLLQPEDLLLGKEAGRDTEPTREGVSDSRSRSGGEEGPAELSLPRLERRCILRALERTNWNQTRAAKLLQISRFALLNRIKKFHLKRTSS